MKLRPYTKDEDDLLRRLYPRTKARDIGEQLNRSEKSIIGRACKLGIRKDRDFMLECAKAGQFRKGSIPHNKGRKLEEYASQDAIERMRKTTFKKGHTPSNHRDVGSERLSRDGYVEVKVAEPNVWQGKHIWLWEQHHGKVAEGMVVYFIDGDKHNLTVENLAITDRAGHCHNTVGKMPIELKQLFQLKGALKRQLNKHEK